MSAGKENRVHIDDLHFEHTRWLSELKLYLDELPVFQSRLEDITKRYTSAEVLGELDQFQNRIYLERNAIDELLHDINLHEKEIAKYAKEHPIAIDHVLFHDHSPLRGRIETNRKMMDDLKKEFNRYLSKWM